MEKFISLTVYMPLVALATVVLGKYLRESKIYDHYNPAEPRLSNFYKYNPPEDIRSEPQKITTMSDLSKYFVVSLIPIINFLILPVFFTRLYSATTKRIPKVISYGIFLYVKVIFGEKPWAT